LALAAKPMAVTFPFILLLLDFWPLQRVKGWGPGSVEFPVPQFSVAQLMKEKLPLFALTAGSCVITVIAQHQALQTVEAVPLKYRVTNAVFSYVVYLWKAVWPLRLSVFYVRQGAQLAVWQVVLCLAFLVAVSVAIWRQRERPYLLFGWLWFLGTMVPMIGIVQVGEQGMADRYAYLPFIGIFIAAVWGLADLAESRRIAWRWSAVAACVVLAILSFLTRRQLRTWESSYALFAHSLEITPENSVAEDFVGATLMEEAFKTNGQKCADEVLVHFQNAARINPRDALAHINIGFCRQQQGNLLEAIAEYQAAEQVARNASVKKRSLLNLGAAYRETRQFDLARQCYNDVLKIDPGSQDARAGIGRVEAEESAVGEGR
jgi:protein O-mannosyl-transferase